MVTLVIPAALRAQDVRVGKAPLGNSAVSVNSVMAVTYKLAKTPVELLADHEGKMVYVSVPGDNGYVAAISTADDSLRWSAHGLNGRLAISDKSVISSSGDGAVAVDKVNGNTRKLGAPLLFQPGKGHVVLYTGNGRDELQCVSLENGATKWTGTLPSAGGICDIRKVNDSLWLVAASGLHAIDPMKGILWSLPQLTGYRTSDAPRKSSFNVERWRAIGDARPVSSEAGVTMLASNIVEQSGKIWFAGREKLVCCDMKGAQLWSYPLGNLPAARMFLYKTDSALFLLNTATAWQGSGPVAFGQPFVLRIDPLSGKETGKWEGELVEGLTDFLPMGRRLRVGTREAIFEATTSGNLNTVSLMDPSYGQLVELVDGNRYHSLNEGYFVPLNAIDKAIYYRSDNGKIYALERNNVKREYSGSTVYKLDNRHGKLNFLTNADRTLVTDDSFELLCSIRSGGRTYVGNEKLYILDGDRICSLPLRELR
jgi:hypothetical protein